MATEKFFTASAEDAGMRLDHYLARHLSCGQRAAKRLVADGRVTINGKLKTAQYKITAGAKIAVGEACSDTPPVVEIPLIAGNGEYAVFYKPAGLHTAAIAGSAAPNMETALKEQGISAILLSRLDQATSGLVAAARSPEAAARFKVMEAAGQVSKDYIALVYGMVQSLEHDSIHKPLLLRNTLDTADRKRTRVLEEPSLDATRYTEVRPLTLPSRPSPLEGASFVTARIRRGARHQIRAHLAFAGYPIVGDLLYGGMEHEMGLFLHHARITMPGLTAFAPPPWLPDFLEDIL
ncbi:MAG: Ribosomal large subunit pseudouridine synthase C [Desulfovibrio sp.]